MNLEKLFCPNNDFPARGQVSKGNLLVHSRKDERAMCHTCGKPFALSKGTLFCRLRTDPQIVMQVIVQYAWAFTSNWCLANS